MISGRAQAACAVDSGRRGEGARGYDLRQDRANLGNTKGAEDIADGSKYASGILSTSTARSGGGSRLNRCAVFLAPSWKWAPGNSTGPVEPTKAGARSSRDEYKEPNPPISLLKPSAREVIRRPRSVLNRSVRGGNDHDFQNPPVKGQAYVFFRQGISDCLVGLPGNIVQNHSLARVGFRLGERTDAQATLKSFHKPFPHENRRRRSRHDHFGELMAAPKQIPNYFIIARPPALLYQ